MAPLTKASNHSGFAVICANGNGVPISFPLGNDGRALISSLRLNLRFGITEEFMYIDEEVYDAHSGDLIQTIGQSPVYDRDTKQWLLNVGRYRVYGVSDSVMAASIKLVTSHRSSTGIVQLIPATRMKIEKDEELITILSDDSDRNLPTVAPPNRSPLVNNSLQNSFERTQTPISRLAPHVGHQKSLSIVDSLKRIRLQRELGTYSKLLISIVLTSRGCSSFHQHLMVMSCLSCLWLTRWVHSI
jgi:hypothetical protein